MIFEYIHFNNYRPYYGKQTLYFRDKNKVDSSVHSKNIILVGGLNGHGKTSLINSIYVCLFGHRSFKNHKEYGEYISNSVNFKHVREGGKEGAIELAFTDDTGSYAIEVTFVDGHHEEFRKVYKLDEELKKEREIQLSTEEFYDFIDGRIPLDVAQFFIFDAEKIRDLVGEQDKDETIRAIQKVVSLELYNQLLKDIDKIHNDLTKEIKTKATNKDVDELFKKLDFVTAELEEYENKFKHVVDRIEILSNKEQNKQQERRQLIAKNSLTKQNLSKVIGEKEQKLKEVQKGLKAAKSDQLQKFILSPYIKRLKTRIKDERRYIDAKMREDAKFAPYEDFINELLSTLTSPMLTDKQKNELREHGRKIWAKINDIQQNVISEQMEILHDLSQGDLQKLLYYPETRSTNLKTLINEKQNTENLLKRYYEQLEDAPEEIDTSKLDKEISELNQELGDLRGQKRNYFSKVNDLRNKKFELNRDIQSKQKSLAKLGPLEEKMTLLEKMHNVTKEFIDQVTVLKARQLKTEIENILNQLFRKDDFQRVEFHPEKFTLTIFNQLGQPIDLMSRSEGEKQLIALAMIWALTKVSGSKFPFVIDTPLARLDSIHRSNLVNHYFTKLSEQVVILSTDTEITKDFYQQLCPFIEKEYILQFDEEDKCTKIDEGYFFEQEWTTWQV
ncbi:DNA sulfur modification protein DndD [Bacillus kexueae]|uniref:DNA sulfur modification protein DndD n=1 Tax=Aeribacillus kexueae TaxID=2078952 RepID=UPI001FAEB1ED|nr:DNA sulfur modification protein DndD [Bacillus kexueae]